MDERAERAAFVKARSMLVLLLATCQQTLLALEATGNVLDIDLTAELTAMVARTEKELHVLTEKLASLPE